MGYVGGHADYADVPGEGKLVEAPIARLSRPKRFSDGVLARPQRAGGGLTDDGDGRCGAGFRLGEAAPAFQTDRKHTEVAGRDKIVVCDERVGFAGGDDHGLVRAPKPGCTLGHGHGFHVGQRTKLRRHLDAAVFHRQVDDALLAHAGVLCLEDGSAAIEQSSADQQHGAHHYLQYDERVAKAGGAKACAKFSAERRNQVGPRGLECGEERRSDRRHHRGAQGEQENAIVRIE